MAFARETAAAAGIAVQLSDESFAEFAARSDLPGFDFIGLHGIWSWISDDNRRMIVEFIRHRLNVGGVLYVSYNTLPGWAIFSSMQHSMTEHARVMGSENQDVLSRMDDAVDFAERLFATNPLFVREHPGVKDRLKKMTGENRHYLAHEYLNTEFHPMHFSTMAKWLELAKVQYACAADFMGNIDPMNLTPDQQAFLKDIHDPVFRQNVRDFMVNQRFRKDLWVKGRRNLFPGERIELLRRQALVLIRHRAGIPMQVTGAQVKTTLAEDLCNPLLDLMADYLPKALGEIEQHMAKKGFAFNVVLSAVMTLAGAGYLIPARDLSDAQRIRQQTDSLNLYLMRKAQNSGDITCLASPVTGGGIRVSRFHQLFLLAGYHGHTTPEDRAGFVWRILKSRGQRLVKDYATLQAEQDNLAKLTDQARTFCDKALPVLSALQLVSEK